MDNRDHLVEIREKMFILDSKREQMCQRINLFTQQAMSIAQIPIQENTPDEERCAGFLQMLDDRIRVCDEATVYLNVIFGNVSSNADNEGLPLLRADNENESMGTRRSSASSDQQLSEDDVTYLKSKITKRDTIPVCFDEISDAYPAPVVFHGIIDKPIVIEGMKRLVFEEPYVFHHRWYDEETATFTVPRKGDYRFILKVRSRHQHPEGHRASSCRFSLYHGTTGDMTEGSTLQMSALWWDDAPKQGRADKVVFLHEGDSVHLQATTSVGKWETVKDHVVLMIVEAMS